MLKTVRQIIICGERLSRKKLLTATQGNISLQLPGGDILITRSGVDKGRLSPADILLITHSGQLPNSASDLLESSKPSSETALHLTAYRLFPGIGAVIHAHPPTATAFAVAGKQLPRGVLAEIDQELGDIQLLPWAQPGSPELAATLVKADKHSCAFLLSNHGVLTLGRNLEEAYRRMELVEYYAEVLLQARGLGGEIYLSPE